MRTCGWLVVWAGAACSAAPAMAQNALDRGSTNDSVYKSSRGAGRDRVPVAAGQGRGLDANSRVGSGGVNEAGTDWRREVALRNAVVTGNVGGGKAFRGNVGYTATEDFRGSTPTDELFDFERDSSSSAEVGGSLRGLAGLKDVLGRSANARPGTADFLIRRTGSGVTASDATVREGDASGLALDAYGQIRGALRSTAETLVARASGPRVLGQVESREELTRSFLVASTLQSVRTLNGQNPLLTGEGAYQKSILKEHSEDEKAREAAKAGLSEPVGTRIEAEEPFQRLQDTLRERSEEFLAKPFGEPVSGTAEEQAAKDPSRPASQLGFNPQRPDGEARDGEGSKGDPEAEPETSAQRFDRMMDELRRDLMKRMDEREERAQQKADAAEESAQEQEDDPRARREADIAERAKLLLGQGELVVDRLLDEHGASDFYSLHLKRGQELLAQGRYFDAEERFSAALDGRRNDPLASAGRVNAQIGAGLYRSASVNLRTLLSSYPEMITARYDERLFPPQERVESIRDALRLAVNERHAFARDAAFLLAYVGFQRGNQPDVRDAFHMMDERDAEEGAGPSALERVVRQVWLK